MTKRDDQLRINGDPAEDQIDGVKMQQFAVQDALVDRPLIADNVSAVLAFVGAKFGFSGIVTHRGVWCDASVLNGDGVCPSNSGLSGRSNV